MDKTVLPLAAVEAMCQDPQMKLLLLSFSKRHALMEIQNQMSEYPDWVKAGMECKNDTDILAVCIHTFLMDWKPEETK